jgi:protein-S-isoprenylcysteine O-methyltransferase Ste14
MVSAHIILALLWILYGLLHSVLAAPRIKALLKTDSQKIYYRIFYSLFAFLSLLALLFFQIRLESTYIFSSTGMIRVAGFLLAGAGGLLMLICIRKYFLRLSGIRGLFTSDPSNVLQISGVHRYVRHPLYLGTFIFLWGLFLLIPLWSSLIAVVLIQAYTQTGIIFEEKKLVAEFGDQYRDYQQAVPKLIPGLRQPGLIHNKSTAESSRSAI